jgi:hypothetical protein
VLPSILLMVTALGGVALLRRRSAAHTGGVHRREAR